MFVNSVSRVSDESLHEVTFLNRLRRGTVEALAAEHGELRR